VVWLDVVAYIRALILVGEFGVACSSMSYFSSIQPCNVRDLQSGSSDVQWES
jgi:hypothetical protein